MTLCSYRHEEIVFESRNYPLCELRDEYEETMQKTQDEFTKILDDVSDLRSYYYDLLKEHNPELLI